MSKEFIRVLCEEDIPCVVSLEEKYFNPAWSYNMISQEITDAHSRFIVYTIDDKVVGYLSFKFVLDEGEINRICVDEDFRNKKIASHLMDNLTDCCKKNAINTIFLEVRKSNLPAIGLYEKYKFEVYSERKGYYRDNNEDALLMKLELTK